MKRVFITIICPVYNEEKYIKIFLDSVIAQDFPQSNMEIFIIDGESDDNSFKLIKEYCSKYEFIKYFNNPNRFQAYAMNIGIKASKGDYIIRLDAHSVYPKNYFSLLIKTALEFNSDNVGGICRTLPPNNTNVAKSIAVAMSDSLGVGNSIFRIGSGKIIKTDTVPFGCYKRNVFDLIGFFDTDLKRNEDDEFNLRLLNFGGTIFLNPNIVIDYFVRDNLFKMSKMFFQYGFFKPLVNIKNKSISSIRQFVPLFFVIFLIFGSFLNVINYFNLFYFVLIIKLYLVIIYLKTIFLTIKTCISSFTSLRLIPPSTSISNIFTLDKVLCAEDGNVND